MEQQRRSLQIISEAKDGAQDLHKVLQTHCEYIVKKLESSNEPDSFYIDNPDSVYYYRGHNPLKLLAKTLLLLEYRLTTLEDERSNNALIAHNRELAKEKHKTTRKNKSKA